jgi:hypothetical protein
MGKFDSLKRTFEHLMASRAHLRRGNELLVQATERVRPSLQATPRLEKAILASREAIENESEVIEALALTWSKGDPHATRTDG